MLRSAKLTFHANYRDAHNIAKLTLSFRSGDVVVHAAPQQCELYADFCRRLSEHTGYNIPYLGDGIAALGKRILQTMLVTKRPNAPRELIWEDQKGRCALCDQATDRYEIDHIQPVSLGGSHRRDNLRGLCLPCHREETERLMDSGAEAYKGYVSQLSPKMTELFLNTPKPQHWHRGPGTHRDVPCLDVRGCRRNALIHAARLPVLGPADELKPFDPQDAVDSYDFFWVRREDGIQTTTTKPCCTMASTSTR